MPHLQNSALQGRLVLYLHNSGFQRRFLCRVYKAIPFPPDKAKARTRLSGLMGSRGSAPGSLVQRELSAKLTEGLLDNLIDMLTDAAEISIDFVVGNPNDFQTIPL